MLPHPTFNPAYTTFVRSQASRFTVGSTFCLSSFLQDTVQNHLLPRRTGEGVYKTTKPLRQIRNRFINMISPSTFKREETFAMAMENAGIDQLGPRINDPDYRRVSNVLLSHSDERPQAASFGVSWYWISKRVGLRCMKCFFIHRFTEVPLPNMPPASAWLKLYVPGNCSEALAMAILEANREGKWKFSSNLLSGLW